MSRHSWTLEKSLRVSSLPFLSTLVRCTTLARLDFGMVAGGGGNGGVVDYCRLTLVGKRNISAD